VTNDRHYLLIVLSKLTFLFSFLFPSGIALLVTAYATVDMALHNRQRRSEFLALRKQLREDSLEAARLAYMTGTATEEQIALVEDATEKASKAGMSLPPLLSAPRPAAPPLREGENNSDGSAQTATIERTIWPGESMVETSMRSSSDSENKSGGMTGWLFGGLKKSESEDEDERLSQRTFSNTSAVTPRSSDAVGSGLRTKAKAAFEQERDNQRRGRSLDQVGLADNTRVEPSSSTEGNKKKGWLW
jgi:hypothetical protein